MSNVEEKEEEVVEIDEKESEIEAEARRMGWVPEEDFRGNKDFWKSAEEYVEAGKTELPILRERYKELDKKYASLEATIKDLPGKMAKMEKQAFERATKELKEKQRLAVEEGDVEAFDAADKQLETLQKEVSEVEKPEIEPITNKWITQNPWYNTDEDLAAYSQGLHGRTWNGKPETLEANLKMVAEKTKQMFPHKFENPNREKAAAVEGNGSKVKTKKGFTYDDLPPEAKQICDEFVRDKVLTKDKYVKEYFAGESQ